MDDQIPVVEWDTQTLLPSRIRRPRSRNERVIVGRALTTAKTQLDHGEFLPWLSEIAPFGDRRARELMKEAAEYDRPAAERWEREQRANHDAIVRDVADAQAEGRELTLAVAVLPLARAEERPETPPPPNVEPSIAETAPRVSPNAPPITGASYDRAALAMKLGHYISHQLTVLPSDLKEAIGVVFDEEPRATVGDTRLAFEAARMELRRVLRVFDEAFAYLAGYPEEHPLWFVRESAALYAELYGEPSYAAAMNAGDFGVIDRAAAVDRAVSDAEERLTKLGIFGNQRPEFPKNSCPRDEAELTQVLAQVSALLGDAERMVRERPRYGRFQLMETEMAALADGATAWTNFDTPIAVRAAELAEARVASIQDDDEARALLPIKAARAYDEIVDAIDEFIEKYR